VNERLRMLMRYQGELSRFIDEALTGTDLGLNLAKAEISASPRDRPLIERAAAVLPYSG
jgi:hypothetical protein